VPPSSHPGFDIPVTLHFPDGDRLHARIRRVNTGFFQLLSHFHLDPECIVEIEYEHRRIEVEVVYCHSQDNGEYHLGLRMVSGAHGTTRQELRLPVDVQAKLTIEGSDVAIPIRLVDMSQSGLGMILSQAVSPDAAASIDLEHGTAFGEIRYCREQNEHTYRAGFWLEEFIPLEHRRHVDLWQGRKGGLSNFWTPLLKRTLSSLFFRKGPPAKRQSS
jgi:hypothetical protein